MLISIVAAGIIVAYFILMPDLSITHVLLFFCYWFTSFILDLWMTLSKRHLIRYERNIILPILIRRYRPVTVGMMMFVLEISLMLVISFLFIRTLSIEAVAVGALAFGTAHLLAFISNLKFVRNNRYK